MSAQKVKCLLDNCSKSVVSQIDSNIVAPFECESDELKRLFSFFLHKAPDIESAHSKTILPNKHAEVFTRMIEGRHFLYQKFCWFGATIEKELEAAHLNGNGICPKCKRMVCKRKKISKDLPQETDIDCLLRHIRNSIAHRFLQDYSALLDVVIYFENIY